MLSVSRLVRLLPALGLLFAAFGVEAQNFRVQCPASTASHPDGNGIKCQQVAGGDGYVTMGDGTQLYLFGFGPLSGLADIYNGQPGTEVQSTFNTAFGTSTGSPSNLVGQPQAGFGFNGAIGLTADYNVDPWATGTVYVAGTYARNGTNIYRVTVPGTSAPAPGRNQPAPTGPTGTAADILDGTVHWAWDSTLLDGHVDARPIMDVGVMNASEPAPLMAIDEDDEYFLTLTNVGMIMRPDLFEQHTVHFHGYANASSFYDGVPDASIAVNIGGSFSYYYLAPDAGTYFWHCHIAPAEHLQMGMVGQLYVRPRQNKVAVGTSLYSALAQWEASAAPAANPTTPAQWATYEPLRKRCAGDLLCSAPLPRVNSGALRAATGGYAYNDGDGSTYYDVEYPIQMMGFDPNFHFVGMTFNPEDFIGMKDKHFLLNGRSYPDTVGGYTCGQNSPETWPACTGKPAGTVVPGPMQTQSADGTMHTSQPLPSVINIPVNGRALLRLSNLSVTEFHTLASLGVPMTVVGYHARMLRDLAGNNMMYRTNSITIGGGESADLILDAAGLPVGSKFYLYTPNLDELSNDAENFGGMMTEVNICNSVDPTTKVCS
jgi:FtsP/CotA-like multicopper oxidase with cupredoxin domain